MQTFSVDAVVFDKDGTLIDIMATWGPAMAAILREMYPDQGIRGRVSAAVGVDVENETLAPDSPVIAETNAEIVDRIADAATKPVEEVKAQLATLIETHVSATATALPGAEMLLRSLQSQGYWVGLATNDGELSARRQIDGLGWSKYFDSIIGYDSGFGGKPGPGMLVESAVRAGCSNERLVMVGDTASDIGAAAAADCRSILVGVAPSGPSSPDIRVASTAEIEPHLRR